MNYEELSFENLMKWHRLVLLRVVRGEATISQVFSHSERHSLRRHKVLSWTKLKGYELTEQTLRTLGEEEP